jgi:nicotinamide-nucleotide amidase
MVRMPRVAVVLSGDELLDGRVVDANGTYVAARLAALGARVEHILTVADQADRLEAALRFTLDSSPELVIVAGGLGTTHDDLTAASLAQVLGVELEEDAVALAMLRDALQGIAQRRRLAIDELLPQARRQALLPAGSEPLAPAGVAPGMAARHGVTRIFAFPGVPSEFRTMWSPVEKALVAEGFFAPVLERVVRTYGAGEAAVAAILDAARRDLLDVGITATGGEVTVKIRYDSEPASRMEADDLVAALEREAPVFSSDGRTVDDIVADELTARRETLAVAESCTGGGLGYRITERPGSSAYFVGGVISYADDLKRDVLGVSADTLAQHGAVSADVATAMAESVAKLGRATYGLSITGVAGPGGGTPEKPVGLVFVGCRGPRGTVVTQGRFPGDRVAVRQHSITLALHLLREALTVAAGDG